MLSFVSIRLSSYIATCITISICPSIRLSFQYFLYYNKSYKRSILVKQPYSKMAGSITEIVAKLNIPSEQANPSSWARSQLRSRLLFSSDFNRRQGVVMSITVSISAVQTHTRRWRRWGVEQSPFTVVDTDLCGRRPPLLSKASRISS